MQLNFKLDVFEGPLDLLLHLISKHKLNINDIEISKLLEQYLDVIAEMKMADLEVASEFLEMAARLVYIKTVSLLPRHEEAEDLKKELTGQLLEYQACKAAAARLALQNNGYNIFVRQPEKLPIDKTYAGTSIRRIALCLFRCNRESKAQAAAAGIRFFRNRYKTDGFGHLTYYFCIAEAL